MPSDDEESVAMLTDATDERVLVLTEATRHGGLPSSSVK